MSFLGDAAQCEQWVQAFRAGEVPELGLRQRMSLLEYLCHRDGDAGDVARALGPLPARPVDLDDWIVTAVQRRNADVAMVLLDAGATRLPISEACTSGLRGLVAELVRRGARINRRLSSEPAPIHLAARSPDPGTVWPLVEAGCDLTALDHDGRRVWEIAPALADELRAAVGRHGPSWFREAQLDDIDHYVFASDGAMFGFNPNDVQAPIWTGDEDEGFGWPNTAAQARQTLEANRELREQVEWFLPILDKIERGEDFSLAALGARVPRRRPSWR